MAQTPQGWFKVNVNGSFKVSFGSSAYGWLVYDGNDKFVKSFYNKIGYYSVVWVELWALRLSIKIAQQLNLTSVILN